MALNIVVCLKQIPNPDLQFQIAADGKDIRREALNYKTNGADEYALEAAVRLKEKHGGRVVALTAGPKRTEQMLREAMAKGADEAIRVAYDDPQAIDGAKVGRILAAAVRTVPHDLVLTGVQSDDYVQSLIGVYLARRLDLPHASVVTDIELIEGKVRAKRELEGGDLEVVSLPLPAVLSIQFGINVPRYAPLPAIMRAARAPIKDLSPAALGRSRWEDFDGAYALRVRAFAPPEAKGHAEMASGSVADQAKRFAQLLREKGFYRR